MKWVSSLSHSLNADQAVQECLSPVIKELGDTSVDFLALFISPQFEKDYQKIHQLAYSRIQPKVLVGCSAGGIIGAGLEVENRPAVSLLAAHLPSVHLRSFRIEDEDIPDLDSSPKSWQNLIGTDRAASPHFILFADPFTIRAENFIMGLDYAYPRSVKVGGLASGAQEPGKNALFVDQGMFRSGLVGASFSGDIEVDALVAQGCRPIGKQFKITACEQNLLMELEDQVPLTLLEEIYQSLNERDKELAQNSLFLGIATDPAKGNFRPGDFLIRNIVAADTKRGNLVIGNQLRVGQTVQFHLRDSQTSHEDLEEVLSKYSGKNRLHAEDLSSVGVLLFSCVGRGSFLYRKPNHDTDLFRKMIGQWPVAGFFCNGEIGPIGGTTYIHGYTSCFGLFHSKGA